MDYYEPNYSDEESAARKWVLLIFIVAVVAIMGLQFQHFFSPPKIEPGGNLNLAASAAAENIGMPWPKPASYAVMVIQPPTFIASIADLEARCASLEARLNMFVAPESGNYRFGGDNMLGTWINPLPIYSATFTFCGGEKGGK